MQFVFQISSQLQADLRRFGHQHEAVCSQLARGQDDPFYSIDLIFVAVYSGFGNQTPDVSSGGRIHGNGNQTHSKCSFLSASKGRFPFFQKCLHAFCKIHTGIGFCQ